MRPTKLTTQHPARQLATLALSLTPLAAWGNGMRLASQDAFATARGEAFVATADNPAAIYYNPAGITQLPDWNLRSGVYGLYYDPTFSPPAGKANAGNTYHLKNQEAVAPQFFLTDSLSTVPVSFGLGIYAPYGGSISWPSDTGFRTVGTESSLTYLRINPVVAVKWGEQLSMGAGVMVDYAKFRLEQGLSRFASPLANNFRFSGDGYSVGYNVGVLWRPVAPLSVGMTFRSQTRFTLEGNTDLEWESVVPATTLPASADFTFPLTVAGGVSYRPSPQWNVEFDVDYTDWSSFGTSTIRQQGTPPWPVKQNIPVKLNWQASWMYELGVTRYLDHGWHVSAGYVFNQNSVPDTYYSPLAADLDRHFFNLGVGRTGKRLSFDLAYQFGYGPDHTVIGSTPSSTPGLSSGEKADGTYQFISHAVMITVGWQF